MIGAPDGKNRHRTGRGDHRFEALERAAGSAPEVAKGVFDRFERRSIVVAGTKRGP